MSTATLSILLLEWLRCSPKNLLRSGKWYGSCRQKVAIELVGPIWHHMALQTILFTKCQPLCSASVLVIASGSYYVTGQPEHTCDVAASVFLSIWNFGRVSRPSLLPSFSSIVLKDVSQDPLRPSKKWALQWRKWKRSLNAQFRVQKIQKFSIKALHSCDPICHYTCQPCQKLVENVSAFCLCFLSFTVEVCYVL